MSLYTDVKQFILNNNIVWYRGSSPDDFDTPGTESVLSSFYATIFEPDEIILRYPSDKISEIHIEESFISRPFEGKNSNPKHAFFHTASIYYGLDKRQLYIEGVQAQKLFNMVWNLLLDKNKDIEYAKQHYKDMYEAMCKGECIYGLPYNNRIRTIKSVEKELFNLIATYIIHCKNCEKDKDGFVCRTGQTYLYFGENNNTDHRKIDKYMNKRFGEWTFTDRGRDFIHYSEFYKPYVFSGLAHKFMELADYVHNDGKKFVLSPWTIKYLEQHAMIK